MTSRDPKGAMMQYGRLTAVLATAWLFVNLCSSVNVKHYYMTYRVAQKSKPQNFVRVFVKN